MNQYRVKPGRRIDLSKFDPDDHSEFGGNKKPRRRKPKHW